MEQVLWKSVWSFLRTLEIDQPKDLYHSGAYTQMLSRHATGAIPLLDMYKKFAPTYHRGMCSTMSIGALFVIARSWQHSRCPPTEEWNQNTWFIYTMEYYTAIKNEDILSFAGKWMELQSITLSKVTQTQKDMHGVYSLISGY